MNTLGLYAIAFLLGTVKFLFAASLLSTTKLTPLEVALCTGTGALVSFNIFYYSASYFMQRAKNKKLKAIVEGTYEKKNAFTKANKFMVKLKNSKSGFWILSIFAPLILSIPLGSIIVAKFYQTFRLTYPIAMLSIVVWAFVLAYLVNIVSAQF